MTRGARNGRTLLIASAGVVAAAALLPIRAQNAPQPQAHSTQAESRLPRFATVFVSENTSGNPPIGGTRLDARGYVTAAKVTLRQLIQAAYQRHALDRRVIESGPAWIDSEFFNIDAKAAADHSVDPDGQPRQAWLMLRTALADHFKLRLRAEIRDVPIYALVLSRSDGTLGPMLRRSDVDCAEAVALMIQDRRPKANCGFQQYVGRYVPSVLTLPDLASVFAASVDRPVIDRTGLSGHFHAAIEGAEVRPPGPFDAGYRPADAAREMFRSLPDELGLTLQATTGSLEVLVIEDAVNPNKPAPLPLVVERAEVVPGDGSGRNIDQIAITIRNAGDKTIVAWGVGTELTFADRKPFSSRMSTDGLESRGLARRDRTVLSPDDRHTFTLRSFPADRAVKDVLSVTAKATLVVFDDDTALGDERMLDFLFARRAENYRAWPIIEKVFADAMSSHADPHEALLAADTALEAIGDEGIRKSHAYTGIRRTFTNVRRTRDFAGLLKSTVADVRARRAEAEAHFERRR